MLKTVIFTQEDKFFIPANIQKIIDNSEVLLIVNNNCKFALQNKVSDFLKWFGFFQVAKMGFAEIFRTFIGWLDFVCRYKLCRGLCSVKAVAKKNKIKYIKMPNINNPAFFEQIKAINPDVILSFSMPQVIKDPLLSFPKFGILNVHGSLLPDNRGCLPSFWYLFQGKEEAGATVHFMSAKIDDGDIVDQEKVFIGDCKTMFQVIARTKKVGGELMVRVLHALEQGTLNRRPNPQDQGCYNTWPTVEQTRQFRKDGKKLI
ncbi:MAG: hypothetical protein FWC36_11125 [Spirochaetes bacterium]|nr:hypothetical protein [Spirochaetota bacterium]